MLGKPITKPPPCFISIQSTNSHSIYWTIPRPPWLSLPIMISDKLHVLLIFLRVPTRRKTLKWKRNDVVIPGGRWMDISQCDLRAAWSKRYGWSNLFMRTLSCLRHVNLVSWRKLQPLRNVTPIYGTVPSRYPHLTTYDSRPERKFSMNLPYILESNPHPFYSFRGLKNKMRITIVCGLDSRSRAGFWKNNGAAVRAVRTIQYNNLLFYLLLIIIY